MSTKVDCYRYWQRELGLADFSFGQSGENFTVEGLPDDEVCIGDRYRIGSALFVVTQAQIDRIAPNMTQPTESRQVNVAQSGFLQRAWQRSLVKLWIVSGARHRPHIDYTRYSMCLK